VIVLELAFSKAACEEYRNEWDLGGGNWGKERGVVKNYEEKIVALFSYNLRCWSPEGDREIRVG